MKNKARNIFENLIGKWKIDRTIEDLLLNKISFASGNAFFEQSNLEVDSLNYIENGKLLWNDGNKSINFSRKYNKFSKITLKYF